MILTDVEERMLDGECGDGIRNCMDLLVRWGDLFDAEKMVRIASAHVSSNIPTGLMERMSRGVAGVRVPTSLHPAFDPGYWRKRFGVVFDARRKIGGGLVETREDRFLSASGKLKKMGFLATYTCAPYLVGFAPRPGDTVCWTGSSGQVIANSFFGAMAGRESASTTLAAAFTGRTPLMGLLKKENRRAAMLVMLGEDIEPGGLTDADYGALGYHIGSLARDQNVALSGLPSDMTIENGRMLVSPLPVSGACTICHVIGVSPGAATVDQAFGGRRPKETVMVRKKDLADAYQRLSDAASRDVEMVAIGCPHLTPTEVLKLASMLEGKRIGQGVVLMVGVSNACYALVKDSGYADAIEDAGGIFVNCCLPMNPFLYRKDPVKTVATNSARLAHYAQRLTQGRARTFYGDADRCILAALKGRWEG